MASGQPPFFYHILMNPSSPHLPLPAKFVKKHLRNKILKKPILKSANGGYLWKLKMKKFDDHSFCFVDGWCKVGKDVGLLFGEFLLFKYVGSSVFLMHVYSVNGCEKILVPRINNFKVVDDEVSVFEEDDEVVFDDDDDDVEDDDDDDDVEYDVKEDDEDVAEEDEEEDDDEVELGDNDDDDEDDGEDEDDVDVDGDDGDPFFVITSSKRNKNKLRFPPDLVAMAKIKTKETITLKNDDGYEKEMAVRSYKQNKSTRYYVAEGWKEFQRSNDISEGDECVLKFITSEDKLCLAKVTKKKPRATEVDNDDMDDDDGMDEGEAEDVKEDDSNVDGDDIFDDDVDDEGKGENAKLVNDDEDDEDDDRDVDGDDGDPSFILTCSDKNQYYLYFSADFVELAGIDTKETITLKNLDGYEKELHVRSQSVQSHRRNQSKNYYLAAGWKEFQRNSNISEGDKFVFKFITSEDKFCVAKITKKKTPARPLPPAAEAPVTEVDDGMDNGDGMDEEGEAEDAKEDDSNVDGDDMFGDDVDDEGKGENAKHVNDDEDDDDDDRDVDGDDGDPSFKDMDDNDVMDADEDVELFDDGNPSFVATITPTYNHVLRMPTDFARLARLDTKKILTLKSLDGYEKEMPLRVEQREWTRYYVGSGWKDILQSTSISEGDKCVFKFIASEDKLCLAKIIKKKTQASPQLPVAEAQAINYMNDKKDENEDAELMDDVDPFFVVNITTSHKCMLWLPPLFVKLAGIDGKKNIIIKCLDGNERQMVLRPVKRKHSTQYCLSMGWPAFKRSNNISEGDECVFKYITGEDKMSLAKVTKKIIPPKEVDVNDLKVDDGMDGKDVVVDDNKDEDENVEPVDDGMDGKDVVVDDNKDEDENVEPVDDGMDGKDVVVDDDKDEDENVELVDDGMYVDAYDNKDEDKDVEFVVTITPSHKSKLRLPIDFVASAGIESKENITMKSLDGNETQMSIRTYKQTYKQRHRSTQYHLSVGWPAFKRSNNISEGDECVFMYTTSEDKMCLAKITKKENVELVENGMEVDADDNKDEDNDVELVDDGMDDKDVDEYTKLVDGMDNKDMEFDNNTDENEHENVELVDDGMDDKDVDECANLVDGMDDKNVKEDAELVDDEDPFFRVTVTPSHKSMLRLPPDFVGLAGINTKKNIIIKSLDGNESQMAVRCDGRFNSSRYHLSKGWVAFMRSNNLSQGDECVFKYITSEDKMCLAKVTKEKTQTSLPSPAEVVKRKRGRLPPGAKIKMTAAENVKMRSRQPPPAEITVAEAVKRKRGQPPPSSPRVAKDVKRKKGQAAV